MSFESFVGVRVAGGLLQAELLSRIGSGQMPGQKPSDYHLAGGETLREAANRAWAYLTGVWTSYRQAATKLPETDLGTTLTRERWMQLLLRELGFGRVPTSPGGHLESAGVSFPISHVWQQVPIHLLGHTIDLDRRTAGVAGAATRSPQSMVQEFLNGTPVYLWALLSNGLRLRLLRDSTSLVGSAYVEFDLEAIFDGELFSDFLLLFNLCHESRFEVRDPEVGPASCWLESWRTDSIEQGSRALSQLRDGVVAAIEALGTGFLAHPANAHLRDGLANGNLRESEVNHGLLRLVYRLLFTFVAEDRGLLLDPDADKTARQRYRDFFSTERLRRVARRRRGTGHGDLWRSLNVVWQGLASVEGRPELGLIGIGGLFEADAWDVFNEAELTNEVLLRAVRHLSLVTEQGSGVRRVVDYRNLGAEELGSIYESLLEYVPSWDAAERRYRLLSAAGNERKSTGSYYTPSSLIDSLLDSALDPVLDRAERELNPEAALLALSVCDPACGSGHFLVAAARRIAKRVAAIRTGDPEPPPEHVREALGDVVGRCIYGVDLNPLAAELAKVSLWLETLDPGRPLAFLDAQIKVGNSLIGATPALLAEGVPDAAFQVLPGDDRKHVNALRKQNRKERSGQDELFLEDGEPLSGFVGEQLRELLTEQRAKSLAEIHARRRRLAALDADPTLRQQRLIANSWCAAFMWPKHEGAPTAITATRLRAIERGESLPADTLEAVNTLAVEYQFFHWHLEFPHLFREGGTGESGWEGGFDVVLGNPPWEHVELKEKEFFSVRDPEIATATGARRKRLINDLANSNPLLAEVFAAEKRHIDGTRLFLGSSGRYPLCGRGRIKTDPVFAELVRNLIAPAGRFGMILPTGIATDATTQYFFKDLVTKGSLASLYDFENRKPLFEGVDSRMKFCLLTLAGPGERVARAEFAFFAHDPNDLLKENARFELTPEEITLLNPNTGTCPVFRTRRDAEITLGIYRRVPVLINENDPEGGNPWGIKFKQGLFNMTSDSHLFHTREELEAEGWTLVGNVFERTVIYQAGEHQEERTERMLPLYEGKMGLQYDHRYASFWGTGKDDIDPNHHRLDDSVILPRYWMKEDVTAKRLDRQNWGSTSALLGHRRVARNTDERTIIAALIPYGAASYGWILSAGPDASQLAYLIAQFNSYVMDYVLRQFLSQPSIPQGTFEQLPILPPDTFDRTDLIVANISDWITDRVVHLSGTGREMHDLVRELGRGGVLPIEWNPKRRFLLQTELDAVMFHLYGINRDDVDYIMETFPIVQRKDVKEFGSYRTKEMISQVYDEMQEAIDSGVPYRSPFDSELES